MKQLSSHSIIAGFALFSMFFGAGNIIFPPYVGLAAGSEWFSGFLCYYLADIGLALVAIFAMLRTQRIDRAESIMARLGNMPAKVMMSIVVICIGPLLGMPRTCAATYSMVIAPLPGSDMPGLDVLFAVLFFGVTLSFSIRESALVELLGKYLTPLLLSGLLLMVAMGILSPIGPISAPKTANIVWMGISAGYQTLDVMAAVVFGLLIVNAMKAKWRRHPRRQFISVYIAGTVAGVLLFIVYGGLCYLGATVSAMHPENVDKGRLVLSIANHIFGPWGSAVFGIVIVLACLTTAIALAGAIGASFSAMSSGKWPYQAVVIFSCVFSGIVTCFGLDNIIVLAEPILTVVYPGILAVIFLSLWDARIKNDNVFRFAAAGAIAVSFCEVMSWYWPGVFAFVKQLPFQEPGFGWTVPSAACAAVGLFIKSPSSGGRVP
jgi:LIVCS family branched-chain amino acid:cation transporter